jgi:hypothetical protein
MKASLSRRDFLHRKSIVLFRIKKVQEVVIPLSGQKVGAAFHMPAAVEIGG